MVSGGSTEIRRPLGWALVGALTVAAVTACAALLSGSFDDTDARLIGTSLSFALCSSAAGAGELVRKRADPAKHLLGDATIAFASATFVLLVLALWTSTDSDGLLRLLGVCAIVALCTSHASLMVAGRRSSDNDTVRVLTTVSIGLATLEGLLGISAVLELADADEGYVQLAGVLVVALVLTTLLVPLIRKLESPRLAAADAPSSTEPQAARRSSQPSQLAEDVLLIADHIEALNADPARRASEIRRECGRLRELARTYAR